jgi:hypothetical protein
LFSSFWIKNIALFQFLGQFSFREIEVKVMSYQDDLENGEKGIKAGWTIQDQVSDLPESVYRYAVFLVATSNWRRFLPDQRRCRSVNLGFFCYIL